MQEKRSILKVNSDANKEIRSGITERQKLMSLIKERDQQIEDLKLQKARQQRNCHTSMNTTRPGSRLADGSLLPKQAWASPGKENLRYLGK